MLKILHDAWEVDIVQLAAVYEQSNREAGRQNSRSRDRNAQLLIGEQLFYEYVLYFLEDPNSLYAVWTEKGQYVSALRLEPFEDGLLLNGLETRPEHRCKGYATMLVKAVQGYLSDLGSCKLYSHVDRMNEASFALHKSCGFSLLLDYAVFLDGSKHTDAVTLIFKVN